MQQQSGKEARVYPMGQEKGSSPIGEDPRKSPALRPGPKLHRSPPLHADQVNGVVPACFGAANAALHRDVNELYLPYILFDTRCVAS